MKQVFTSAVLAGTLGISILAGTGCVADWLGFAKLESHTYRLTPEDDIQETLDAAAPGDTIILTDGLYHQSLLIAQGGTPGRPITLRAANGGASTLSGAMVFEPGEFEFEHIGGGLYRAAVPHRVWWVMAGDRNLVNYGLLDNLRTFQFPNIHERDTAPYPCVPEGFAWQDGALFVRLESGTDPTDAAIEVNGPGGHSTSEPEYAAEPHYAPDTGFHVPGAGHMLSRTLANITVKANHIAIEGLRLRLGAGSAVVVHGNDVAIRDCYMSGAHLGVFQPDSVSLPTPNSPRPIKLVNRTARDLTVEHCEFSGYPCHQWRRRGDTWAALYDTSIAASFMNYGGPRSIVRHNWMYECFDGIQPRGNGTESRADASELAYNLIQNCADDSIEFDSATAMNLRVRNNVLLDGMCMLSLCPVMGGELTIDHNILYISPEKGFDWCVLFKMGSPWGSDRPTRGLRIFHNTMVNTRKWIYWCGEDHRYEDNIIENNIFYCAESRGWGLQNLVPSRHNLYCGHKIAPDHMPEVMHYDGSPFVSTSPMDFTLRPDGPAVDAGATGKGYDHPSVGKAPDLGAIELGKAWQFPRPGPRWARGREIVNRPTFPASLPPKWVGLD